MRTDNLPQVTEAIKPVLGEYYCYDSTVSPCLYGSCFPSSISFFVLLSIVNAC